MRLVCGVKKSAGNGIGGMELEGTLPLSPPRHEYVAPRLGPKSLTVRIPEYSLQVMLSSYLGRNQACGVGTKHASLDLGSSITLVSRLIEVFPERVDTEVLL